MRVRCDVVRVGRSDVVRVGKSEVETCDLGRGERGRGDDH